MYIFHPMYTYIYYIYVSANVYTHIHVYNQMILIHISRQAYRVAKMHSMPYLRR